MPYSVVEQYAEIGYPLRNADVAESGSQYFRAPGWVITRHYWAYYVPEADIQTYVDKVEEITGSDFVLQGEPTVQPMHGLLAGFFYIHGMASKRFDSDPSADEGITPSDWSFYGVSVIEDDFGDGAIDTAVRWTIPTNTGNNVSESGGNLICASTNSEYGWLVTKTQYPLDDSRIFAAVTQHNLGGRVQFSPTRTISSTTGLTPESNWYEIRLLATGMITVYRSKGGVVLQRSGSLGPYTAPYGLRFQIVDNTIHAMVQPGLSGRWTSVWNETFDLTGVTPASLFYVALCAENTPVNGTTHFGEFAVLR